MALSRHYSPKMIFNPLGKKSSKKGIKTPLNTKSILTTYSPFKVWAAKVEISTYSRNWAT